MVRSSRTISPRPARIASRPAWPLSAWVMRNGQPLGRARMSCLRAMPESSQISRGIASGTALPWARVCRGILASNAAARDRDHRPDASRVGRSSQIHALGLQPGAGCRYLACAAGTLSVIDVHRFRFSPSVAGPFPLRRKFMKSLISAIMLSLSVLLAHPVLAEVSEAPLVTVNINQASAAEIAETLSGIGLAKAEAIVSYREENGNFADVEELAMVKGIGPATVERNRDRIALQ